MNDPTNNAVVPLLKMYGIDKSFPGVRALDHVDLDLFAGEVLGLVGENGAGKSTLIKVLGGAHQLDAGVIEMDGRISTIRNPVESRHAGVAVIYQEFSLVPGLSARENIFLGREHTWAGFTKHREEYKLARELFDRIGVDIDPDELCRNLSVAEQQIVEIAKSLSLDARIVVMDEPSATLTLQEVDRLFAVIRDLTSHGIGIIYVSHRLDEIFAIADRVTVLRDGELVGTRPVKDVDRDCLIEMMVGRTLDNEFPKERIEIGEERLVVNDLSRGDKVRNVSFSVRGGEVLALTGLVGAGRTETVRLLFGADKRDSGSVELDGRLLNVRNPQDAIRERIGLLSEDRKAQGLVMNLGARENFGLPNLSQFMSAGFVNERNERKAFGEYIDKINIKLAHQEQAAQNLSGGNQQKLILAKWLQRNCEIIIFDEPTRGIDIGSKHDIYLLINDLAAAGKAIIMISSELPEVLGMADRILVMHEGRITGEITDVEHATQEEVLQLAIA